MSAFALRPLDAVDSAWVARHVAEQWGSEVVIAHGALYRPAELPGFVAVADRKVVGLLTYRIEADACEIVTLDTQREGQGIGAALLEAAKAAARQAGCRRLWLITTNDNTHALRFYQKRGFHLVTVHRDAVAAARVLKPEIPLIGNDGIPVRDEIELEMSLAESLAE